VGVFSTRFIIHLSYVTKKWYGPFIELKATRRKQTEEGEGRLTTS